jgi:DNA-binding response OmpR family regulator
VGNTHEQLGVLRSSAQTLLPSIDISCLVIEGGHVGLVNGNEKQPIILVLVDVEETRDAIKKLLSADGYSIQSAREEEDAVVRAKRQSPDLLLVSLGGTGDQVIATARRVRHRAELTHDVAIVIFCSPTITEGAEVETGGNVYITRPDNFDQLRRLIRHLLRLPVINR